jgi:RNA polymerase sigma-70 factor (ECF subfamily)
MYAVVQNRGCDVGAALIRIRFVMSPVRPFPDDGIDETDADLAGRAAADADAFGSLYDRYCDRIYGYVQRRLRDHEAAEDVTAEIFLKALRAIDSYNPETAPFAAWLYRIAGNAVVDHIRTRRPTLSLDNAVEPTDSDGPVDERVIDRAEVERVWAAVDRLGPAQRMAVILRYGGDLPIADIAKRMGRTEGAVKLLLNRGMAGLRAALSSVARTAEERP